MGSEAEAEVKAEDALKAVEGVGTMEVIKHFMNLMHPSGILIQAPQPHKVVKIPINHLEIIIHLEGLEEEVEEASEGVEVEGINTYPT